MPTQVYLNGKYMGEVDNSSEFIKNLKQERKLGNIRLLNY